MLALAGTCRLHNYSEIVLQLLFSIYIPPPASPFLPTPIHIGQKLINFLESIDKMPHALSNCQVRCINYKLTDNYVAMYCSAKQTWPISK